MIISEKKTSLSYMRGNAIVDKRKMLKFRVASEVRRNIFEEEEIRTRCVYRYVIRSLILTIFAANLMLYVMHVVSHEVICTIVFIFYQSYFR